MINEVGKMIDIKEITQKIMEEENNSIAKAFTSHIGSLLMNNGIVPVMTKHTFNDLEAITDTDKYKIVKKFGISFDELDTSEHDKEIYNKAIDDCKYNTELFREIFLENLFADCYDIQERENIKAICKESWIMYQEQLKGGVNNG